MGNRAVSGTRSPKHHPQFVLAHDDAHQGILRLRASLKMLSRFAGADAQPPRVSHDDIAAAEELAVKLAAVLAAWDQEAAA